MEDTTKGSEKNEDGQKRGGGLKETKKKIRRSNIPEIRTPVNSLRLETRGKTPAVVSKSHKLAIPGRPRHLRTHTCKRTLAHVRESATTGGWAESGYKARRKRDECREESRRVSGVETG